MDKRTRTRWNLNIRDPDIAPLYAKWLEVTKKDHDPAFDNFDVFYWWALYTGYEPGMKLMRYCLADQFSPDNCYFIKLPARNLSAEDRGSIARYNRTVNGIRATHGLPPLGGALDA